MFSYCIINVSEINPNRGGSYIDSPDLIKNKKATINPIDKKHNKCFYYVLTVALNHEEIGKMINFSSEKDDWKKFEKKNVILLMFCMLKNKSISCLCFKT